MDENISKIQYLSATGTKIYKVTDIDFHNLIIEATETDLSIADVPESEVFPIEEFGEFRIRLINGGVVVVPSVHLDGSYIFPMKLLFQEEKK